MENNDIIKIARAKAEKWLDKAYDEKTRARSKTHIGKHGHDRIELNRFTTIWNSEPAVYGESWEWEPTA